MPEGEVGGVRIIRIAELDGVSIDVLKDEDNECLGLVEVNNKLYKYNLREYITQAIEGDAEVVKMKKQVEKLTKLVNSLLEGIDENVEITG